MAKQKKKKPYDGKHYLGFWSLVEKPSEGEGCWIWHGAKTSDGYGVYWYNGIHTTAHRVAWIMAGRKIPRGKQVCHHCDNKSCIRINHLFVGTAKENMQDASFKGRIGGNLTPLYDHEFMEDIKNRYISARKYGCMHNCATWRVARAVNIGYGAAYRLLKNSVTSLDREVFLDGEDIT